jgi:glyoxylase-like metal-dependent hydrolase (beta-lactamase superfamily II)
MAILLIFAISAFSQDIIKAVNQGDLEQVKTLLEKNPELLNTRFYNGINLLHHAAHKGHKDIVELLIAKGIDVNAKNEMGYTPLDWVIDSKNSEIIEVLKSNGSQITPVANPEVYPLSKTVSRIVFPYHMYTNIGASIGSDGILLIDTGFNTQCIDKLKAKLQELGNGDIKYIINTHHHGDHTAGNSIGGDTAKIIGYADLEQLLSEGLISEGKEPLKGQTGKTFDKYYTMQFNGEDIKLIPYPGIHSETDLIIYFTDSNVVHMGDLLLSQSFPAVGKKVVEYLGLLDKVLDIFPSDTKFISGHGKDSTYDDVKDYQKMLLATIEIIKTEMMKGKSFQDMQKEKILKDYESWGTFLTFLNTDYWINAIYSCYRENK